MRAVSFSHSFATTKEWKVLYSVCCTVFCLLVKRIFGSIKLYGAIIPLFIVIMIAVCPIFFDFRSFLGVQLIFPPTYYVNAAYDSKYLLYMVAYSVFGIILCFLLDALQKIKIKKLFSKSQYWKMIIISTIYMCSSIRFLLEILSKKWYNCKKWRK